MRALHNVGAAAPGPVAPESDNARGQAGVVGDKWIADNANCASRPERLRAIAKNLIVSAACWGFPASWAQWLIERGGLTDA
jgi:hypothetical protein